MKETLLAIIGQYVPFAEQTGIASLDIVWIFSAILFITLIVCTAWFACRVIVGVLHD